MVGCYGEYIGKTAHLLVSLISCNHYLNLQRRERFVLVLDWGGAGAGALSQGYNRETCNHCGGRNQSRDMPFHRSPPVYGPAEFSGKMTKGSIAAMGMGSIVILSALFADSKSFSKLAGAMFLSRTSFRKL